MSIYKDISYLLKLFNDSKKIIIIILFLVNSLGYLYYKNLKKEYQADIIVTAIPSAKGNMLAVDIFSIFEQYFRDPNNLESWLKLQKFDNMNNQINKNYIVGYQVLDESLKIYNEITFRNAVTLQRSIYITVPADNKTQLKNLFLYSRYIADLLNNLTLFENDNSEILLENLKLKYFQLYNDGDQVNLDKLPDFLRSLQNVFSIKQSDSVMQLNNNKKTPLVKVSPPKSIYTESTNLNKILFSTVLLSIILIIISLVYSDFKNSRRK